MTLPKNIRRENEEWGKQLQLTALEERMRAHRGEAATPATTNEIEDRGEEAMPKRKRWKISDIMDAIVEEHMARGADVSEHIYGVVVSCPRCAVDARDFARRHDNADPLDVIRGRNVKFAAAFGIPTFLVVDEEIADKLVVEAQRLNVPMNG